jgi:hypothetical protein
VGNNRCCLKPPEFGGFLLYIKRPETDNVSLNGYLIIYLINNLLKAQRLFVVKIEI